MRRRLLKTQSKITLVKVIYVLISLYCVDIVKMSRFELLEGRSCFVESLFVIYLLLFDLAVRV